MSMTLTVAEIMELAGFAGLTLHNRLNPTGDDLESEITIVDAPKEGVTDETTGERVAARHLAFFTDYPEEGSIALGETSRV